MLSIIINWVFLSLLLLLIGYLVPGIFVGGLGVALVAALVMGLVNLTIRPLVLLLTLPLNFLTLGLLTFVVNALMFMLVAYFVPGFRVDGFMAALMGSLILGLLTALLLPMANRWQT